MSARYEPPFIPKPNQTTHATSRSHLVRIGPSTPTSRKDGLFKNGSISAYVRRSVVTWWVSQLRVV